jgi:hypothetical protein
MEPSGDAEADWPGDGVAPAVAVGEDAGGGVADQVGEGSADQVDDPVGDGAGDEVGVAVPHAARAAIRTRAAAMRAGRPVRGARLMEVTPLMMHQQVAIAPGTAISPDKCAEEPPAGGPAGSPGRGSGEWRARCHRRRAPAFLAAAAPEEPEQE